MQAVVEKQALRAEIEKLRVAFKKQTLVEERMERARLEQGMERARLESQIKEIRSEMREQAMLTRMHALQSNQPHHFPVDPRYHVQPQTLPQVQEQEHI
mgnify:CR=1 FL=1